MSHENFIETIELKLDEASRAGIISKSGRRKMRDELNEVVDKAVVGYSRSSFKKEGKSLWEYVEFKIDLHMSGYSRKCIPVGLDVYSKLS